MAYKVESTTDKPGSPSTDAFLAAARERFQLAAEAEQERRELALDDLRFRAGEQWPENVIKQRNEDNRPCLVVNRLPQFLRQVCNEQRQNRPGIQVNPVDDGGDVDTAEIIQGLIRHIEQDSHAAAAYDTAFESAATIGWGYFRILTDYVDAMSFDQKISIERIRNPFSVYFDPSVQTVDYSDARFCFIRNPMPKDEFQRRYPKSELCDASSYSSLGDQYPEWVGRDAVQLAEYYYTDHKLETLCRLEDGSVVFERDLKGTEIPVIARRKSHVPIIRWALINGCEVLDEKDVPGDFIPVVPVLGDEIELDGRRDLMGIVRFAKDPQRMLNYWTSAQTEMVALAPRAPFIAAEGQLEGYEGMWRAANVKNLPFLLYKPRGLNGEVLPPPQRQFGEPPIQAISIALQQSSQDLKATTGLYDASLGAQSNETSGKAILARQKEGDVANFHFVDNLSRSLRHAGRIILSMIPYVYDTARVVRIIGLDDEHNTVSINQPTAVKGVEKTYDLTVGKYDVTISTGPSYMSRRQEAVESIMALVQAFPPLMQVAGDLLVKSMDWPGAQKIAERLKKMLPPNLADQDGDQQGPNIAQMQQLLQQLSAQNQQLTAGLHEAAQEIEKQQYKIQSEERIEFARLQAQLEMKAAELGAKDGIALLQHQIQVLGAQVASMGATDQQARDQQHQREMSEAQRAHDLQKQDMGQRHQADMQISDQDHQARQAQFQAEQAQQLPEAA